MKNSDSIKLTRIYCNICLEEYPCKCKSLYKGVEISEADPCQFKRMVKIDKIFELK